MRAQPARWPDRRPTVHQSTIVRRRLLRLGLAAILVAGCAGCGAEGAVPDTSASVPDTPAPVAWDELDDDVQREDPAVFDYERVQPASYEVVGTNTFEGIEFELITFDSPAGGTATAHLVHPIGEPVPGAAVLWGHGLPGTGQGSYPVMAIFACAGATSLVVDAPYARPGGAGVEEPLTFTDQDRLDQIQLIVDMRRGLDILADLGGTGFGFGGVSYGASMGAQLIGVDDRVSAAVLLLGNSGVVQRFTRADGTPTGPLWSRLKEDAGDWIVTMLPIEPVYFIGDTQADVLFMNGELDPFIPPDFAAELHAAGPAGSKVYWMDAEHDVPFSDMAVHNEFLGDRLGIDAGRLAACTDQLFPQGW